MPQNNEPELLGIGIGSWELKENSNQVRKIGGRVDRYLQCQQSGVRGRRLQTREPQSKFHTHACTERSSLRTKLYRQKEVWDPKT